MSFPDTNTQQVLFADVRYIRKQIFAFLSGGVWAAQKSWDASHCQMKNLRIFEQQIRKIVWLGLSKKLYFGVAKIRWI